MTHLDRPRAIDDLPSCLRAHYRKLVLIGGEDDLRRFDGESRGQGEGDAETLIVCCDWLLWQRLAAENRHCVYYELGIVDWDAEDTLDTELHLRANDWLLERDSPDETLFHGVSLGRLFCSEASMALINFHRIHRSLSKLIERFSPQELHLFDYKYDINRLNRNLRTRLIADVAAECGVAFVDHGESGQTDAAFLKGLATTRQIESRAGWKLRAIKLYTATMSLITRLRRCASGRLPRVLVMINSHLLRELLPGYDAQKVIPVVLSRSIPKKPGFVARCIAKGVLLTATRSRALSAEDHESLARIRAGIKRITDDADGLQGRFMAAYVQGTLIPPGALEGLAETVLEMEELIERTHPARIVIDSVLSRRHLCVAELASTRGIKVDYTWHSPHTPLSMKMGALGGDPRHPVLVSRCLSWGRTNDIWLRRIDAREETVRIGSPFGARRHPVEERNRRQGTDRHVLLLQYTYNIRDIRGLNHAMYHGFVSTVKALEALGYRNIRFKLHPGPGRWEVDDFAAIAELFGINCEIRKLEPYVDCLAWADVVIGPIASGTLFETLSAGKPFHAQMIAPYKALDPSYYDGLSIIFGTDDLARALARKTGPETDKLLEDMYSLDEIPDPAHRFWSALENAGAMSQIPEDAPHAV